MFCTNQVSNRPEKYKKQNKSDKTQLSMHGYVVVIFFSHMSPVTCLQSHVFSHMSAVTCPQ